MVDIDEMAARLGITPKQLIIQTVEREGSVEAAARFFQCYPNTIKQRLTKYGLKAVSTRTIRVVEIA